MTVRLESWGAGDFPLLEKLMGDPAMTEHLGGPETPEKLAERQTKYEAADSGMFKIVDVESGQGVGSVGFWDKTWRGEEVWETGWSVIPALHGRGIASAATLLAIDLARDTRKHRYLHAFPNVTNEASNALCRKLGFEFLGEHAFEYPKGNPIRCNDWRFDLFAGD